MQAYKKYFSNVLRMYRLNAGLTQRELAEKTGLSKTSIASYEQGTRVPKNNKTIKIIAKALNIDSSIFEEPEAEANKNNERQYLELTINKSCSELNNEGLKELSRIASWLILVPYFKNN